ncbi:MAG: 16S rRNA (cytosine(967)-C(5))-methyltransferase RsmB [Syntrophales bacterium]|nr:16S rRNA (cytosine(967)-C(5))-methyltransferase RsmB [Syntrophales bacterium]
MTARDPRSAAVDIISRVEEERSFLEPLLAHRLSGASFSRDEDRGLLTELSFGVLRMRNRLDWVIERFYRGDHAAMDRGLRNILRVALYQILCMDRVPSYAAVNEAVKLAKRRYPGRQGLVNALLRNVIRSGEESLFPVCEIETAECLSRYHSHPLWLVEKWINEYGPEETRNLCEANNRVPPLAVRVNRLKTDPSEAIRNLAGEGLEAERSRWSPDGLVIRRRGLPVGDLGLARRGHLTAQDEASQLVSFLVDPRPGEVILDMCSGVGIKAAHMAAMMGNEGSITAVDVNPGKLDQGEALARAAGVTIIRRVKADGRDKHEPGLEGRFDRILLDAPCSGLGTIRRKPEARWFVSMENAREMARLQRELLQACPDRLKPGGVLVYAVCTISVEENEEVVRDFLFKNDEFRLVRPPPPVDGGMIDDDSFFRTSPHRHGTDGFFGAVMVRNC